MPDRKRQRPIKAAPPLLEPPKRAVFSFQHTLGERIENNLFYWIQVAPQNNPAMLQMFADRDRTPPRDLLPWSGEFAGKYLISAVQTLRLTRNQWLLTFLSGFVSTLLATQRDDGYLGPFPSAEGMIGPGRWDLWGQYHIMLGLYLWYKESRQRRALDACLRCADLFCRTFLNTGMRVLDAGSEEMNQSCSHIFLLLYAETGKQRYLRLVREIEKDWETPPSGDYVHSALAGKAFHETPKPRWESLHAIQAIAELCFLTGETKYRQAYEQIWWSIVEGDRHNTGGFSSGEQATGNPYDPNAIETCCTVAWMAVTLDYLRMTGDSRAADELELATWNATLGAQCPSGRWWTYNTPMDGERKASAHDIVFQARPGSPELNCCSVNGPRSLGMLSEWAVMVAPDGLALNWYGPATFTVPLPSGRKIRLELKTGYPFNGHVRLTLHLQAPERFTLRLRIPGWSRRTHVTLKERPLENVAPGTYLTLDEEWQPGDTLRLILDMTTRLWVGEREAKGKVSIYRGPVLFAYDPCYDVYDPTALPALDLTQPPIRPLSVSASRGGIVPFLFMRYATTDGKTITLCDFASAGAAGNRYVSWLPASGFAPAPFSRDNPLRAVWPADAEPVQQE